MFIARATDSSGAEEETTEESYHAPIDGDMIPVDASGAIQALEDGLGSFGEDVPWLMRGLDDVAKTHTTVAGKQSENPLGARNLMVSFQRQFLLSKSYTVCT